MCDRAVGGDANHLESLGLVLLCDLYYRLCAFKKGKRVMTQSAAGSHGHFELFKSRTFEVDHKRAMVADEHDQHGGTLKVQKPHLLVAVGGLWQLHLNNAEGKEVRSTSQMKRASGAFLVSFHTFGVNFWLDSTHILTSKSGAFMPTDNDSELFVMTILESREVAKGSNELMTNHNI